MDCRSPSSSVQGILQARILEWVAIFSSRESSRPRDQTQRSKEISLHLLHWQAGSVALLPHGKPPFCFPSTLCQLFMSSLAFVGENKRITLRWSEATDLERLLCKVCVYKTAVVETLYLGRTLWQLGPSAPDDINSNHYREEKNNLKVIGEIHKRCVL